MLLWKFFWKSCLRIRKQRFLHGNEIVKYLHNFKHQDINQGQLRKPLRRSTNYMKNNYPTTTHTFFTDRSILSYFLQAAVFKNFAETFQSRSKFTFLRQPSKKNFLNYFLRCFLFE